MLYTTDPQRVTINNPDGEHVASLDLVDGIDYFRRLGATTPILKVMHELRHYGESTFWRGVTELGTISREVCKCKACGEIRDLVSGMCDDCHADYSNYLNGVQTQVNAFDQFTKALFGGNK